jgi:hypothetical protein
MPIVLLLVAVVLGSPPALAADRPENEIGLRYWYSTGETRWSHNAQSAGFGNPTSVLAYERIRAQSAELHFNRKLPHRWFVRGVAGLGELEGGLLDDEDYAAGQVKFSDTTSAVRGGALRYLTLDAGRPVHEPRAGRPRLHAFAGYQYWSERQDAYGLENAAGFTGAPTLGRNVPVISNEMRWNALRIGVGAFHAVAGYAVALDVAFVPYAELRNRDFHYLRADLGPTPNIRMDGSGTGLQLDAEVRRQLAENLEFGLGLRYWVLRADGAIYFGAGAPLPLNRMESRRGGITATLTWRY